MMSSTHFLKEMTPVRFEFHNKHSDETPIVISTDSPPHRLSSPNVNTLCSVSCEEGLGGVYEMGRVFTRFGTSRCTATCSLVQGFCRRDDQPCDLSINTRARNSDCFPLSPPPSPSPPPNSPPSPPPSPPSSPP